MEYAKSDTKKWTKDETILAFELYWQMPFSKIDARNKDIINLAKIINRTPNAVALRLVNFASLDPYHQSRGVSGMSHGSKLDKTVFDMYYKNLEALAYEAYLIKKRLNLAQGYTDILAEIGNIPKGEERNRIVKTRIGQSYFRKSILALYDYRCCITQMNEPNLLIASHIKPWNKCDDAMEKTNPRNGLCLNAFHDRAFDQGLITIDKTYKVIISSKLSNAAMDENTKNWIKYYQNRTIRFPDDFSPDMEFIEYHNDIVFIP